jgi:TorA maturation chaperone TorD
MNLSAYSRDSEQLHVELLFAAPYSSYQRGTNEKTNGLIRRYLPKGTPFRGLTDQQIRQIEEDLNNRPMNLFKVPGPQYVTPYEAVYRDTREINGQTVGGLLAGQSTVDVQKWCRLAAIEVTEDFKNLPDHIALEFNHLAHLCFKERQFAGSGDEARLTRAWEMQRDFLASRLAEWIAPLRDKIHEKSATPATAP